MIKCAVNYRNERARPTELSARAQPLNPNAGDAKPSADMPVKASHWVRPDILGDILVIARRAGAAEPVEIHLRPEVHDRHRKQTPDAVVLDRGTITDLGGIPVVLDDDLPAFPGYEIHRALPGQRVREERPATSDYGADGARSSRAA